MFDASKYRTILKSLMLYLRIKIDKVIGKLTSSLE